MAAKELIVLCDTLERQAFMLGKSSFGVVVKKALDVHLGGFCSAISLEMMEVFFFFFFMSLGYQEFTFFRPTNPVQLKRNRGIGTYCILSDFRVQGQCNSQCMKPYIHQNG